MPRIKTITDQALIACAREVFIEQGASASTREIARRAGISEGVLFQRFPTKASLFLAAMVPDPIPIDRIVAAADEHTTSPRKAVHAMAQAVLTEFEHHIPVVRQLIASHLVGMDDLAAHFARIGHRPLEELTEAITQKLTSLAGYREPDSARTRARVRLLISAIHNAIAFDFPTGGSPMTIEQQVDEFVEAAWQGLAASFNTNEQATS